MADYTAIDLGRLLNDSTQQDMETSVKEGVLEALRLASIDIETVDVVQDALGATLPVVVDGELKRISVEAMSERIKQSVAQSGAATTAANVSYTDTGSLLGGATTVQDALGAAAAALKSVKSQTDEATEKAAAAEQAAAALSDFLENERVTGVSYDAGERVLSLARGGENSSLGPLTVTLPVATEAVAGLMGAADKQELKEHDDALRWKKCLTS